MHERDTVGIVVNVTQGALGVAMGYMLFRAGVLAQRARRLARGSKPIASPVVSSRRIEQPDNKRYKWRVETRYAVEGLGELVNTQQFETEGQAILHGRLHKVGVVDPVIPNLVEPGQALLPADLKQGKGTVVFIGAALLVIGGLQVYLSVAG